MKSPMLMALLLATLSDEQLRELAAAQARAKHCACLPEVRDRQATADGCCWNCGKPVGP